MLLLLLASVSGTIAQQSTPASTPAAETSEQPIKTTLCKIKADPAAFNGKLVEVSGIASYGFEESLFEDLSCFWTTGANLPGMWMEYGGTAGTDTMYCCGLPPQTEKQPLKVQGIFVPLERDELFRRFDLMLHARKGSASVRATVQARIFAIQEKLGNRLFWQGYGHMGCCMLLALEKVVHIDSPDPGPSVFELIKRPDIAH